MRIPRLAALAGLLAACGADDVMPPPDTAGHAMQERVCAEVVAEHAGLPVAVMAPEWTGVTDTGTDIVFVHHGGTLHTCEIDAAGRVLELRHPQE